MRYLSVLFASQPDTPPSAELFHAIATLGQEATAAGVMLDVGGLLPQTRTDVTVESEELSVLDGPFTETKELVSYVVYEVRSKEDVIEWTRRFMDIHRELWPGWTGTSQIVQVMPTGEPPA
jgi:hypothetical protein